MPCDQDVRYTESGLPMEVAYLEEDIIEAPGLGGQHGGDTLLALLDEVREVDGARAGVTSGPGLARAGVGGVPVGTEGLTVNPCLRDGVDRLVARKAEELRNDGG